MFIANSPSALLYLALPIGFFAVVVVALVSWNTRQVKARQALALRRGWILQPQPEKRVAWRIGGDGIWTLDAIRGRDSDDPMTYSWSAPLRRDASLSGGEIRIPSRKTAQWIEGSGGQKAMKVVAGLGHLVAAKLGERVQSIADSEFADFPRPDLADFRLMVTGVPVRAGLEIVGDSAQSAFLSWKASLPQAQQISPNLAIELGSESLCVTSTEPLESAARLEAFIEFCTALKR